MAVVLPSFQEMISNSVSINAEQSSEITWRVLIQRTNGRNIPHALNIQTHDSGEEVMKNLRRLYLQETAALYRILTQTILMRRPVVSIVRITAVCPSRLTTIPTSRKKIGVTMKEEKSLTYQRSSLCSQRTSKPKEMPAKSTSHIESATKT